VPSTEAEIVEPCNVIARVCQVLCRARVMCRSRAWSGVAGDVALTIDQAPVGEAETDRRSGKDWAPRGGSWAVARE